MTAVGSAPSIWVDAVERIGLGGAVILILTLGFVYHAPAILNAFNEILKTILTHLREAKRIPRKVADNQKETDLALTRRKRKTTPRA